MKTNDKKPCKQLNQTPQGDDNNSANEPEIDPQVASIMENWERAKNPQKYQQKQAALQHWAQHLAKILAG